MKRIKFQLGSHSDESRNANRTFYGVLFEHEGYDSNQILSPFLRTFQLRKKSSNSPDKTMRDILKQANQMKDAWIPTYKNLTERIDAICRNGPKNVHKDINKAHKSSNVSKDVKVDRIMLVKQFRTVEKSPKNLVFSPEKRKELHFERRANKSMLERPYHSVKLDSIRPWTREGNQQTI